MKEAAQLFERGGLVLRAIECFERVDEWEHLLHCLSRNQSSFGEDERLTLVQRYVPIALNNIYKQHGMLDEKEDGEQRKALPTGDADNLGYQLEAKIKDRYKATDAVIEEEVAFDEYGEELIFEEESSDEEETKQVEVQAEEKKSVDEPSESLIVLEDDALSEEEDGNNIMSKDFRMEQMIKD